MILPVAARELRLASRRSGTYWTRAISAGAAFLICFWMLVVLAEQRGPGSRPQGRELFQTLFWFGFAYVLSSGMRFSAAALSRERREGTLGLLFLTDLKAFDIVLGKLAGTSLDALYSTVAILPVLSIPILMGGVTMHDYLIAALVLLDTMFFSLAAGILASSFCRDERESFNTAFLLLLVLSLVLPVAANALTYFTRFRIPAFFNLISPGMLAFSAFPGIPGVNFWMSLLVVHLCSWIFLGLSSVFVVRVWRDKPHAGWRLRWQEWKRNLTLGKPQVRLALRRRLLEVNPILWLSNRERTTPWYVWFFLSAMIGIQIFAMIMEKAVFSIELMPLFYITAVILKYWVASNSSHGFASAKASGTLELILSTSLEVKEILRGHWLGILRQFRDPFLVLLAFETLVMILGASRLPSRDMSEVWVIGHTANMVLLVADSYSLTWVALWQVMIRKNAQVAASAAGLRVLVLPWLALALFLMMSLPGIAGKTGVGIIGAWLVIGIFFDIVLTGISKDKLEQQLRLAAAEQGAVGGQKPSKNLFEKPLLSHDFFRG